MTPEYHDSTQGLDVPGILAQLTLEEKVTLLDGEDFWRTSPLERLGVPSLLLSDGPHGLRTHRRAVTTSA